MGTSGTAANIGWVVLLSQTWRRQDVFAPGDVGVELVDDEVVLALPDHVLHPAEVGQGLFQFEDGRIKDVFPLGDFFFTSGDIRRFFSSSSLLFFSIPCCGTQSSSSG